MFSVAKMGMPAVTVPTIGTSISSREEPSELPLSLSEKISIALGFAGSLLIYPFLSSLSRWPWTVDVDLRPTASHISLTEGG